MRAWEGMERFLQLSLGSQVGAGGVALIAVIELKRMVQQQVGFQGPAGSNSVKLTAEEWRTIAGIHERKTFERAKARLEELGVLHIGRDGKLLEITLWPDQIPLEESPTCDTAELNSEMQPDSKNDLATNRAKGRRLRLLKDPKERSEPFERTEDGTFSGTKLGTCQGTGCGTGVETSYIPESVNSLKCGDNSLQRSSLRRYPLRRYPLYRSSLNRQYNTGNNHITNNDQRSNGKRSNGKRNNNERNNLQQSGGKQNNKQADTNLSEQRIIPQKPEPGVHPTEEMSLSLEFAALWVQEVGHPLTSYEKEGLVRFLRLGYAEELFVEALRCAVAADNRRMGYVLGILRNWYQEGVQCVGDVALAKKNWEDLRFLKRAKIG